MGTGTFGREANRINSRQINTINCEKIQLKSFNRLRFRDYSNILNLYLVSFDPCVLELYRKHEEEQPSHN